MLNYQASFNAKETTIAMSKSPLDLEQFSVFDWPVQYNNNASVYFGANSPASDFLSSFVLGDELYIAAELWGNNEPYPEEGPILEWVPVSQGGEITDPRTGEPKDPLYDLYGWK